MISYPSALFIIGLGAGGGRGGSSLEILVQGVPPKIKKIAIQDLMMSKNGNQKELQTRKKEPNKIYICSTNWIQLNPSIMATLWQTFCGHY